MKINGLSKEDVLEKEYKGLINYVDEPQTKSIKQIIYSNVFTYFNFLNIALGLMVLISGIVSGKFLYALKNCLFVNVIFTNTIISTVEEILAKKTIDKLNVISQSKVNVIRDGKTILLSRENIVMDDVILYSLGNQVIVDGIILDGTCEVNESFITGEEKTILKEKGDTLLSGSFITSGNVYVKTIHIGKDNYISKITSETKYIKKTNSVIYNSFEKMLKILSILLIFVGILFFINQMKITSSVTSSIMSMVSALIGMIPEGLVLLTSSAMAVSVIRLKKYKVLVQDLYSIELLARVDTLCLDKTGTITEGVMEVSKIICLDKESENDIKKVLKSYTSSLNDNSKTFLSIKSYVNDLSSNFKTGNVIPFSSSRKYSAVEFEKCVYFLGSPENLVNKKIPKLSKYEEDYRTILLAKGSSLEKTNDLKPVALILIQDKIKENADKTLEYFKNEGVDIKIISGDNINTVSKIAQRAGLSDIRAIDMSKVKDDEIDKVSQNYNIFGRVLPEQKKQIVLSLKKQGHFVAMTGDGVNDCLALKESDCSIAMANGSDATKNVSQFVLLDSKIDNLPLILKEGRRSINNIERSSSLLLSKTIFTILLIISCLFLNTEYFFIPIHLTLITFFTIGVPSFILALEPNHDLVKGNFLFKVFIKALPSALTVVFNVVIIKLFQINFNLSQELCSTLTVFLTAMTGFIFLNHICKPYNLLRASMICILFIAFEYCIIYQYDFFSISTINKDTILIFIVLFICSMYIFDKLKNLTNYILQKTKNV